MSSESKPTVGATHRALDVVGDRWSLWLLTELDDSVGSRFSDLAGEPGLSRRVLTERLNRLVEEQLVVREPYSTRPLRHRYRLTERGMQLQRLAVALLHVASGGKLPPAVVAGQDPLVSAAQPSEGTRPAAGAGAGSGAAEGTAAEGTAAQGATAEGAADGAGEPRPGSTRAATSHPSDQLLATDPDAAWKIFQATVAALVRYDNQYRTQLVETLDTYLQCDASVSVTAARLYAHRHTIRYRLGRVRELTGLDVDSLDDRERLALGLRALRMFRNSGRDLEQA